MLDEIEDDEQQDDDDEEDDDDIDDDNAKGEAFTCWEILRITCTSWKSINKHCSIKSAHKNSTLYNVYSSK